MIGLSLRPFVAAALLALCLVSPARAETDPSDWAAVTAAARGQTVYWYAWGGDPRINLYKAWVGEQVAARYGVTLTHVKLSDTAEAVSRVLAEKTAGAVTGGAVDLIWINGENFAAMKREGLLFGPWAEALPNFALTAPERNPAVRFDFTVPVEGYEAPYGAAQLVFIYDSAAMDAPPKSMTALLAWATANPGRFAYPQPPDFLGSTFLKQALIELGAEAEALSRPADQADYEAVTVPLWAYLDALHPQLWRGGAAFPQTGVALMTLLGDGEVDIAFSFDPGAAPAGVADGVLPPSVRSYGLEGGTIGNANFVAIPFNASAKEGAMVVANFLLSPEAQARKADPAHWGGATILDIAALPAADRALFDAIEVGPSGVASADLGAVLPEPHPSWMERLEADWQARYGAR